MVAESTVGTNILDLARDHNVAIDAPCSGNASCGKCRVKLVSGKLESQQTMHITDEEFAEGWRLACTSKVTDSDAEILVPDIASAYRSRMKVADLSSGNELKLFYQSMEDLCDADISFKNEFFLLRLDLPEPSLEDTMPDNERLTWGIERATGVPHQKVSLTFHALKKLAKTLRDSDFHIQCVIEKNDLGIKVWNVLPEDENVKITGLAIDIGTTTVSGVLVDLRNGSILQRASTGNGQIRYGADVINRIIESVKPGGAKKLQDAVIKETINPMIAEMCKAEKMPVSWIYRICVAGNTTMNHLFLGVDANPVRMEPFIPSFFHTEAVRATDLKLYAASDAKVAIAPNIGSYVGGDITAGVLSSTIWARDTLSLFIDLGTNGEIVFGNSDFLMSCACSAGPAFEGGDISCGMRATDGAIEACHIDKKSMEPTFRIVGAVDQKPIGLCGSGLIDVIAELFRCGIINSKGKFVREGRRVRRDENGMGSYVIEFKENAASVKDIEINEVDIDNFIRAKGAIFSAINIMLSTLDMDVTMIDDIYVAGGIGSGINMKNAVMIGMLPDVELSKFHYIGNSSLTGAYAILCSKKAAEKVDTIARNMTYMELSTNPYYMDEFVGACFLPHTNEKLFPSVAKALKEES